jgi:twitching motility protein PilT
MVIEDLFDLTIKRNASDLHLSVGYAPVIRVDGNLSTLGTVELTEEMVHELIYSILADDQKQALEKDKELDMSYTHSSGNRFRINIFYELGHIAGAFRLIPQVIRTVEELGLPTICHEFTKLNQGLILVTGPTGQGKTTTLAAILQEINVLYTKNIITIEDPIEYVFPKGKSMVNQRELEHDTLSWANALRSALRQDPNVVLIGEMRDYETISSAITIAETGHLVFATLHTNSASQTIDRIIDVFPENQQNQVRSQLASILEGIISQRLLESILGGRVVASEVLLSTPAVRNVIREGKTYQIDNIIQTSGDLGMITLEKSLVKLVREGKITLEAAQAVSLRPDEIIRLFK